jgi:hypothetical protein
MYEFQEKKRAAGSLLGYTMISAVLNGATVLIFK